MNSEMTSFFKGLSTIALKFSSVAIVFVAFLTVIREHMISIVGFRFIELVAMVTSKVRHVSDVVVVVEFKRCTGPKGFSANANHLRVTFVHSFGVDRQKAHLVEFVSTNVTAKTDREKLNY